MKVRKKMSVANIKVPMNFAKPNPEKVQRCMDYYEVNGKLDKDIVVGGDGIIRDGYIRYLVLVKNNVKETEVSMIVKRKHVNPTLYVFGRHMPGTKEYCWRVTNNTQGVENLYVGNRALVDTRDGKKMILVTRIETLDEPPVDSVVKRVLKCYDI